MGTPDEPPIRSIKAKAAPALGLGLSNNRNHHRHHHHHHRHHQQQQQQQQPPSSDPHGSSPDATASQRRRRSGEKRHDAKAEASSAVAARKPPLSQRLLAGCLRFLIHTKNAVTHSVINLLLVFVPVGIIVKAIGLRPEIVFSMNAIAIIPLAGLLAHATEVVAAKVGDALGALLNVSFGNAVELILFIILLASNQIEVVQAALLGSILANLLLILGMAFLFGGLRYQEQVYNSTVTQMSGVMLALAVTSLLLPTAFHAAFSNYAAADRKTLVLSRGTSIVLLLVYALYLLFQLKSHRYLYASTPQHIIDEESQPGVLAGAFDTSSSDSSDSTASDSEGSTNSSNVTMKRKAKRMVKRLRRKSSAASKDAISLSAISMRSTERHEFPFEATGSISAAGGAPAPSALSRRHSLDALGGDEADKENAPITRDFETSSVTLPDEIEKKYKGKNKRQKQNRQRDGELAVQENETEAVGPPQSNVAFADPPEQNTTAATTTPSRRVYRPALPSLLSNNVFSNPQNPAPAGLAPNIRMAARREPLRRIKSMPECKELEPWPSNVASRPATSPPAAVDEEHSDKADMSIKAAIFMLLFSTGLVAVCADFMSDAIGPMVQASSISQSFIGLIILPIVGNAAEHVTAVTTAMKNKMDLSIGIAVGSSIQIAIFITPVVVILGWIMHKQMTLYFNIFETVALFVTVLVVNFLVLDGRSNYLEGSLLIAAYIIIALASFYYPDGCDASAIGGNEQHCGANGVVQMLRVVMKRTATV